MQDLTDKIKTFSIGFDDSNYNEATHAKKIASYLKTDHTELYLTAKKAIELIPYISTYYDEPFSDSSQIPTLFVSNLTRKHVVVSLTGDAGDELFGGYNRYLFAYKIWKIIQYSNPSFKNTITNLISKISPNKINLLYDHIKYFIPKVYAPK